MVCEQPPACSACGAEAAGGVPLGWSSSTGPAGTRLLCPACTSQHLRSIEGKLDEAWW